MGSQLVADASMTEYRLLVDNLSDCRRLTAIGSCKKTRETAIVFCQKTRFYEPKYFVNIGDRETGISGADGAMPELYKSSANSILTKSAFIGFCERTLQMCERLAVPCQIHYIIN